MSGRAMGGLSVAESDFLQHITRWGSDGYPVHKLSSGKWVWHEAWGIKGAPVVYKTRRQAHAAVEAYIDALLEKRSQHLKSGGAY